MPPDTSRIPEPIILNQPLPDSFMEKTLLLPEQRVREIMDSLSAVSVDDSAIPGPHYILPQWAMFLVVLLLLGIFYLAHVYLPQKKEREESERKDEEVATKLMLNRRRYERWLAVHNPYYASLPPGLQQIFLQRTLRFMQDKEFRFHHLPYDEFIMVLISGSAVQLTLGLKNYLMEFFKMIHVIKTEYTLKLDNETYYGHVSKTGIYISWDHFVKGYADYGDGSNVGLHEMAHAVSFDIFLGEIDRHDIAFRSRLEEFMEEGRPVFRGLRKKEHPVLEQHAAVNIDEFWAVCVETFFENPEEFQRNLPDLYLTIVLLLNQDPLKPSKIVNSELAGYEC